MKFLGKKKLFPSMELFLDRLTQEISFDLFLILFPYHISIQENALISFLLF